jgi:hypothetical protein
MGKNLFLLWILILKTKAHSQASLAPEEDLIFDFYLIQSTQQII